MRIEITSRWAGLVFAIGIALTLTGGFAWAANRAAPATISACAKKSTGALRLNAAGKACATDESAISWNQAGPAGTAGPRGAAGPAGISGFQIVQTGSGFGHTPAVTVSCPAGKKVISAGYDTEDSGHPGIKAPFPYITQNLPNSAGTQWVFQGNSPSREFKIQGYAICAFVQG